MRIQLKLSLTGPNRTLPLNSNTFQTALIYRIINSASSEYSKFLHDQGYVFEGHKRFKLFTYSQFIVPEKRIEGENLVCLSRNLFWYLASPVAEFLEHLILGLFEHEQITLRETRLRLQTVEVVPEPNFRTEMKFSLLSPMVVSTASQNRGPAHYLRHEEGQAFSAGVRNNLLFKYRTLHGRPPQNDALTLSFDRDYIAKRKGRVSKLIRIHQTQVKGVLAPFTVTGSKDLIGLGYACGFGEKNSMGFGMAKSLEKSARV